MLSDPSLLLRWGAAFLLTLLIELPIYGWLGHRCGTGPRAVAGGGLGTLMTHPLLWFAWPLVVADYLLRTISGELLVCLLEGVVLRAVAPGMGWRRAMAVSFLANAASYGTGVALHVLNVL
jgi:hypothetical protein